MDRSFDPRTIGWIGRALGHELRAVQQYAAESALAALWGEERLAEELWAEAVEELRHARELMSAAISRGVVPPPAGGLPSPRLAASPAELAAIHERLEWEGVRIYESALADAERWRDQEAANLFQSLLEAEVAHWQRVRSRRGSPATPAEEEKKRGEEGHHE
ncbi:MAG: ferritin-like domain-containing protein [Hydrogenophilus sp.]|nr:ferritin-like domain-containing protein [Hydrogenophilus sp.]